MEKLRLVIPNKEYEQRAKAYLEEFLEYGSDMNGDGGLSRFDNYDDWLEKLRRDSDLENMPKERVPATTYFCINYNAEIIGNIQIRHYLNEALTRRGGHIAYSVRPTKRRKGYASEMLKLALSKCANLGLDKVLITCDKENIASAKTIQNNGGVLETEFFDEDFSCTVQKYWINLKKL